MRGWLTKSFRRKSKNNKNVENVENVKGIQQNRKLQCDVVIGLQYGDEGKGKVVDHMIKNNQYTACVRYNGR